MFQPTRNPTRKPTRKVSESRRKFGSMLGIEEFHSLTYSLFILHQPTRKPTPNKVGSSICTRSPDYGCYKSGRPACCDSDYTCPSFMTMCDNVASGVAGSNFCGSWAPDYGCWPSTDGRPPCCSKSGGAYVNCPPSDSVEKYQPCESEITETE